MKKTTNSYCVFQFFASTRKQQTNLQNKVKHHCIDLQKQWNNSIVIEVDSQDIFEF
jgi:hypothetical protein